MTYLFEYKSPIGVLTIASDGESITEIWMNKPKSLVGAAVMENAETNLPVFVSVRKWLDIYFNGKNPSFTLPLAPKGTDFQRAVWSILCTIPYAELVSYGYVAKIIAKQMGKEKMSAQAVGGAVGANPISIIIPCHRVIGSNGNLTGYAGGMDIKIKLLELEHVDMSNLWHPLYNPINRI